MSALIGELRSANEAAQAEVHAVRQESGALDKKAMEQSLMREVLERDLAREQETVEKLRAEIVMMQKHC